MDLCKYVCIYLCKYVCMRTYTYTCTPSMYIYRSRCCPRRRTSPRSQSTIQQTTARGPRGRRLQGLLSLAAQLAVSSNCPARGGHYYPYGDILEFHGGDRVKTDAFIQKRASEHKGYLAYFWECRAKYTYVELVMTHRRNNTASGQNQHRPERCHGHHLSLLPARAAQALHLVVSPWFLS